MIKNIPVDKILKIAMSDGGDFAEIFAEHTNTTAIAHEDKKIERAAVGIDTGYGIRVITSNKTAYGYTNDPEELLNVAATMQGKINSSPPFLKGDQGGLSYNLPHPLFKKEGGDVELVKTAAETAWKHNSCIKQVQVNLRHTNRHIWIANSKGLNIENEKDDKIMVVLVIVEKDGVTQTGYEPAFENFIPEEIAQTAVKRALLMLSARFAPRGIMPVVISSSAGGTMIHEAVGHGLEADLAGQGMSVYQGKIGKEVASKLVTVIDDATLTHRRGSFRFDDEGNPSQKTILIENGILKNYIHSLVTSRQMGVKPTGNGRRESYRNRPIPRMTNTMVEKGKDDPDSIIRSVTRGLLVKKMGGGQVNTVNGDFVFEAQEAYIIENGKIGEPVRGATIIGNGPEALMDIDMIGTDLGFGIGTCGKEGQGVPVSHGMPTIRIPEITIGGTN